MYAFSSVTMAIVLEALPFLALGALISGILEVYFPADRLVRFIPKNIGAGIALGLGAGLLIPTCECGVVPVVRRLMGKGVPPYVAIVYMLSAPILNPVVLASTYMAFGQKIDMVLMRAGAAILIASVVGFSLKGLKRESLLRAAPLSDERGRGCHHPHDHDHPALNHRDPACHDHGCGCAHDAAHRASESLLSRSGVISVFSHGAHEFLDMGKYLILGALAASFFKLYLPPEWVADLSGNPVLAILGMMALAVLLSVCSEADAFVAASFISFPAAAQLAFITLGPMLDLKLIGMFSASFKPAVTWRLMAGLPLLVLVISLAAALWS